MIETVTTILKTAVMLISQLFEFKSRHHFEYWGERCIMISHRLISLCY